ncbi:putative dehydrogenase [Natranaerovirga pectinivora]|uniref:Putative dehydrogenase n=1 Tax=Natranaerovirga pectinivora TaxID=682400 RepID=A0A4R3MRQ5_9FIRM|nr:Gfo/Idh/MocA family oxidoreductase [Natranaerovirga pectinivora]TCT15467.1 putative dehydrogenase [Natranaerovirga pectinivora]
MKKIRVGIIGLGNMGMKYAVYLKEGKVPNAIITAVTTRNEEKYQWAKNNLKEVACFSTGEELLSFKEIDAVIIATPHNTHPYYGKLAFSKGLHVLIEKPSGVILKDVEEMNALALESEKTFGIMFDRRFEPIYKKVKEYMVNGYLGELYRINWISTVFRTQGYYNSNDWRGTWDGEGGGVLLNQTQHQLDLWQWFFGMPTKLSGFCKYGKYHNIEVEDDFTGYMEYDNGLTGVFVASTYEAPGTERLEIVGEWGKIVLEDSYLKLWKLNQSTKEVVNKTNEGETPSYTFTEEKFEINSNRRLDLIIDWVKAIRDNKTTVAPGIDGINPLLMTKGFYLSSDMGKVINVCDKNIT